MGDTRCSAPGCATTKIYCKGMCKRHHSNTFYHQHKERIQASRRRKYHEDTNYRQAIIDREREKRSDPVENAKILARYRKATTGFCPMLVAACRQFQNDRCAICTVPFNPERQKADSENADHCHVTKMPRGLLCGACNKTLGFYEKHQRRAGLVLAPYDAYLANTPVSQILNLESKLTQSTSNALIVLEEQQSK